MQSSNSDILFYRFVSLSRSLILLLYTQTQLIIAFDTNVSRINMFILKIGIHMYQIDITVV